MSRALLIFLVFFSVFIEHSNNYCFGNEKEEYPYISEYICLQPEEVSLTQMGILICRAGKYYMVDSIKHLGHGRYEIKGINYLYDKEEEND